MTFSQQRRSLLSSQARIQVPWIKVTIGKYTFGVFTRAGKPDKDAYGTYTSYQVQYPQYVKELRIVKINGQVNQYSLRIEYPVTINDDPNFFEKVFSSVSNTREIIFSYGDASQPAYIYKDEKAIITDVQQQFNLESSSILYNVSAISGAALKTSSCRHFFSDGAKHKPSDKIKELFRDNDSGLKAVFTGMSTKDLDTFIAGDDEPVKLETKLNMSALDYLSYLTSCMIPQGTTGSTTKDIYILTIHDDTTYEALADETTPRGPHFKVTKTSYLSEQSDAYEIDIGYNTSTLVTQFAIDKNENYALYYDYQKELYPKEYVRRLNREGKWEDVYAPVLTSNRNTDFETNSDDLSWWTKVTKYPIQASITIQGLLRPATLMTYLRLNVIFPGGHKHISSGLYIVTKQTDVIDESGYKTTLNLTKISGDNYISTNPNNIKQ